MYGNNHLAKHITQPSNYKVDHNFLPRFKTQLLNLLITKNNNVNYSKKRKYTKKKAENASNKTNLVVFTKCTSGFG